MATAMYAVEGLFCESCVTAVADKVHSLSGVTALAMDLVTLGRSPLIVTSGTELSADAVRSAVENVGFTVLMPATDPVGRTDATTEGDGHVREFPEGD